jgi:hypothetical protein
MDMTNLRTAIEQVDREIAALPVPSSVLHGAWSQLVSALELGTATRKCPHCGNLGMRDATLCGYCWKKLVPPDDAERCGGLPCATSPGSSLPL